MHGGATGLDSPRQFRAEEYDREGRLAGVELALAGDARSGWKIARNGSPHLELGEGYELLRTASCGVCSTDLDRRFLPFPLPQVIGHELIATDRTGARHVIEINASHLARGVESDCGFCRAGLETHCPERLVLGIHDLPGGFGPFVLAPRHAILRVPEAIPNEVAVLTEPFAAVLHAVEDIAPSEDTTVAVLGPRRLGLLAIAALAAHRRDTRRSFRIFAWSRHVALRERALAMGADAATEPPDPTGGSAADIVIDTTGQPAGFDTALRLARREVHLKSTHGQPSGGLAHTTELVVDEICMARLEREPQALDEQLGAFAFSAERSEPLLVAWLCQRPAPRALRDRATLIERDRALEARQQAARARPAMPHPDVVVVDRTEAIDEVIRPSRDDERPLVRPRGGLLLHPDIDPQGASLVRAIAGRGLRVSTSRCGDFRRALDLMEKDPELREAMRGLVTHRLPADRLAEAFSLATRPEAIKVVIEHPR